MRFKLFNWIEFPFALFWVVALVVSIYWTFNSFFIGLFLPPIIAICVAGGLIRWINPQYRGFALIYHTLALAGVFLLIFSFFIYKMFLAPMFNLIAPDTFNKAETVQPIVQQPKALPLANIPTVEDMFACRPRCSDLFGLGVEGIATFVEVKSDNSRVIQCQCINPSNTQQKFEYQVTK